MKELAPVRHVLKDQLPQKKKYFFFFSLEVYSFPGTHKSGFTSNTLSTAFAGTVVATLIGGWLTATVSSTVMLVAVAIEGVLLAPGMAKEVGATSGIPRDEDLATSGLRRLPEPWCESRSLPLRPTGRLLSRSEVRRLPRRERSLDGLSSFSSLDEADKHTEHEEREHSGKKNLQMLSTVQVSDIFRKKIDTANMIYFFSKHSQFV